MMKLFFTVVFMGCFCFTGAAQEIEEALKKEKEETKKGFKKENLFAGGNLNVSFFNGTTALGVNPFFGYNINRFIDVALSMNVSYISQRDYQYDGDKLRQNILGPGAFVRIFPVKFLFAQAQYEHNFIRYKYFYPSGSGQPSEKYRFEPNSLLLGAGYANGRENGKTFYYFSVLFDVLRQPNSPYTDNNNRSMPLFRAGFNIGLFDGGKSDF
jgi:hypothetical protein